MILRLRTEQVDAILGAMRSIAAAHGAGGLTDMDGAPITAAARMYGGPSIKPAMLA